MPPRSRAPTVFALLTTALLACTSAQASEHREHPRKPAMSPSPSPSVEASPTVPPTAVSTAVPGEPTGHWHAPTAHEHGDSQPEWLTKMFLDNPPLQPLFGANRGGLLSYDVPFNTSAAENRAGLQGKHFAMKGFHLKYHPDPAEGFSGLGGEWLDGYARVHFSSGPTDRGAQFHSGAVFIAGQGGLLAIRQGWINTGAVDANTRIPNFCPETRSSRENVRAICDGFDAGTRPRVMVVTAESLLNPNPYTANGRPNPQEQWYPGRPGIGFDWGWGISDAMSMAQAGERLDDYDFTKWGLIRGANGQQSVGLIRQIDLNAGPVPYENLLYYTTQYGEYVADPKGPECQAPNICLAQFYNKFPGIRGRSQVTDFPGRGQVQVPN
jgi:hypothetical protein